MGKKNYVHDGESLLEGASRETTTKCEEESDE